MVKEKVLEKIFGQMGKYAKAFGKIIQCMV